MTNIKDISLMYLNSLLVKFDKQLIYGPDVVSKTNFGLVWGSYTLETEINIRSVYAWNYLKFLPSWYWHKADTASQGHISLVGSSVVCVGVEYEMCNCKCKIM
jgi:hypothetical protein